MLFAEIKNDRDFLPPPGPTPTFYRLPLIWEYWGQGLLLKTRERRVDDSGEARAAGVREVPAPWAREGRSWDVGSQVHIPGESRGRSVQKLEQAS